MTEFDETPKTAKKIAVLIDADNTPAISIESILEKIKQIGEIETRRVYGDWNNSFLSGWKIKIARCALEPIQQFAYTRGKNATDISMVIDAMDLLYEGKYNCFCIVSSDSDFTALVARLRQKNGTYVCGFGQKKAPKYFREACDDFFYIDNDLNTYPADNEPSQAKAKEQSKNTNQNRKKANNKNGNNNKNSNNNENSNNNHANKNTENAKKFTLDEIKAFIFTGIEKNKNLLGWAAVYDVGRYVSKQTNGKFDIQNYGEYEKLSEFLESLDEIEVLSYVGTNHCICKVKGS